MHFSLITIQLIIFISSQTLASDYELPLHLASRQSGFFCVPIFLLYPDTWTTCGSGYISPLCNCCTGGLIGCLKLTQSCAIEATGVAICCDDSSPDCPPTFIGGGDGVTSSPAPEATPTFQPASTPTESINSGAGFSTTTPAARTSNEAPSTKISGPSSSTSRATSTRVPISPQSLCKSSFAAPRGEESIENEVETSKSKEEEENDYGLLVSPS